eukprot:CAMPEP_0183712902 /NCGR_PEP_ID=MMETSP0737-20130205/7943_1 /TAXON_ID=385413 /ORGANISM="Thalassiosira miniscula, Strain CCMP1093" /LENGTH=136 /DNA_ID=CAMNT_0025941629 /DNA_START=67 /DNA_END=478 /DNA_ORIENTATION=-
MTGGEVCALCAGIKEGMKTIFVGVEPSLACANLDLGNPIQVFYCLSYFYLQPYTEPTFPALPKEDSEDIANAYVLSFLETTLEREKEKCYEEVLEEEYALQNGNGLPVVSGMLFLEDFNEDFCKEEGTLSSAEEPL